MLLCSWFLRYVLLVVFSFPIDWFHFFVQSRKDVSLEPSSLLVDPPSPAFASNFLFALNGVRYCRCGRREFEFDLRAMIGDDYFLLQAGKVIALERVLPNLMVHVFHRARGCSW
jgi:hypothetical protein